jgi:hypothetical protein
LPTQAKRRLEWGTLRVWLGWMRIQAVGPSTDFEARNPQTGLSNEYGRHQTVANSAASHSPGERPLSPVFPMGQALERQAHGELQLSRRARIAHRGTGCRDLPKGAGGGARRTQGGVAEIRVVQQVERIDTDNQ